MGTKEFTSRTGADPNGYANEALLINPTYVNWLDEITL